MLAGQFFPGGGELAAQFVAFAGRGGESRGLRVPGFGAGLERVDELWVLVDDVAAEA